MYRQTPCALDVFTFFFFFFFEKSQRRVRLPRLFELLCLLPRCGRRSGCCRYLVVDKIGVVPIVLSVAVGIAGGESMRNVSVLRNWRVRCRWRPSVSLSST